MNEEELKKKVEALRNEIIGRENKIKKIHQELTLHRKELSRVKIERDRLNNQFKEKLEEIKKCKEQRNELNGKLAKLKKGHKAFILKIKALSDEIKKLKKERDCLNKKAKGSEEALGKKSQEITDVLLNDDIPLEKEIKLFDDVLTLKERLDVAREANRMHDDILRRYNEMTDVKTKAEGISKEIEQSKGEADNCHKRVMEFSKEITEIRKKADAHHAMLQEKYGQMKPFVDQISAMRKEIKDIQEEISTFASELEKIRTLREEQKRVETAKGVKEKLLKSKRVTIDDFRILLEKGELP